MQPIGIFNYSSNNNHFKSNINFTSSQDALAKIDNILSNKTVKLVKRADNFIEDTWAEIRNKNSRSKLTRPEFKIKDKENDVILKPLYNTVNPSILLEKRGPKYIDRIILERRNPNNFKYEKSIITPSGSATVKMYDSLRDNDPDIILKVDDMVSKYFPKFLPKVTFKESLNY